MPFPRSTFRSAAPSLLCLTLALTACHKKPADLSSAAPTAVVDGEAARRQAKLDYGTMEDAYLNDPKGQWANAAKASSSRADDPKSPPAKPEESQAWRATGKPDGQDWNQASQDIGFDWLEVSYERPVHPTELRAVFEGEYAVQAITRVELIDTDGKANMVWQGLSDQKMDDRGSRTWFVRKFDKTPYAVEAVKLTFANNVASGYKDVDAVQLVGD